MNTHTALLLTIITLATACERTQTSADVTQACFLRITSNGAVTDSLILSLTIEGDSVSGKLSWLPMEKDKKTGTVDGVKSNTGSYTLDYRYQAEGIEGNEKLVLTFDTLYAYLTSMEYQTTDTLTRVECDE